MSGIDLIVRLLTAYKFTLPFDQVCDDPNLSSLADLEILQNRQSGSTVLCNACDFPHSVKVGIDPITDKLGWRCPDSGFVEAGADQLKKVQLLPGTLVDRIADALQCTRRRNVPLVENLLWKVGWYEFSAHDVNVYLASSIRGAEDASAIAGALRAEAGLRNGLVITPDISGTAGLTIAGCRFAEIGDVISIKGGRLSCDQSCVAGFAGVVVKADPGRSKHRMRGEVADMIKEFYKGGQVFRSTNSAVLAIQEAMKIRYPEKKPPGRSVIEDEIATSEFCCFLVGK